MWVSVGAGVGVGVGGRGFYQQSLLSGLGLTSSLRVLCRVGQNRIYAPHTTVYLVISLPKIPYIHQEGGKKKLVDVNP